MDEIFSFYSGSGKSDVSSDLVKADTEARAAITLEIAAHNAARKGSCADSDIYALLEWAWENAPRVLLPFMGEAPIEREKNLSQCHNMDNIVTDLIGYEFAGKFFSYAREEREQIFPKEMEKIRHAIRNAYVGITARGEHILLIPVPKGREYFTDSRTQK